MPKKTKHKWDSIKSGVPIADPLDFFAERAHNQGFKLSDVACGPDDSRYVSKVGGSGSILRKLPLSTLEEVAELARAAGITFSEDAHVLNGVPMVLPMRASDERVDRHGDIVRQDWILEAYEQNPVLLFAHDWDSLPTGNSIKNEVVEVSDDSYEGPALSMLLLFMRSEAAGYSWPESVYRLLRVGALRTSSVGFYPGRVIRIEDDDEREELGLPQHGAVLERNELIELSIVPIPANIGATLMSLRSSDEARKLLRPEDVTLARNMNRVAFRQTGQSHRSWRDADAMASIAHKAVFGKSAPSADEWDAPSPAPSDIVKALRDVQEDLEQVKAGVKSTQDSIYDPLSGLERELNAASCAASKAAKLVARQA